MATIARDLAKALILFARDRHEDERKAISILQHMLCVEFRKELVELEQASENPPH